MSGFACYMRSSKSLFFSSKSSVVITLLTYPLVIGQGTRLFPDTGPDTALELVESRATPSGVTIQVYRPTGRPRYGEATADMKHVT